MISLRYRDQLPPGPIHDELESIITQLRAFLSVSFDEDGQFIATAPTNNPIGAIIAYGGSSAPSQWLMCDGAQVSRVTYKLLFEVIGTTYGAGDGSTTFNLPDLRQRFPLGKAASGTGSALGATGGAIDYTHSEGAHTHTWSGSGTTGSNGGFSTSTGAAGGHNHAVSGSTGSPSGSSYGFQSTDPPPASFTLAEGGHTHSVSGSTDSVGDHSHSISVGDHTHTISLSGTTSSASAGTTGSANPPYQVVNFIIFANA